MSDYTLMEDIVNSLADCTGLQCSYESFVGMGNPSDPVGENCGLISIWKERSDAALRSVGKCNIFMNSTYHIRIVKCCGEIDTTVQRNLNAGFDDQLVQCFYEDVNTVVCCLIEGLPGILGDHGDISCRHNVVESIIYDESLLGTCFGARISFSLTQGGVCCVDPQ